ncbi:helix-turn-helix domain-containing protein [Zavarzinia sp. CC-PAN008]|uniref:helix-turn-helix domain-containing protein n=1 Tax=Zavarzinia sp. CC-PAN008 TaxID=3243332 RepID=UPI003F749228
MTTEGSEARLSRQVDEHVGRRIRERRTRMGMTQEQLAAALRLSYQQVQKYETGANRVSAGRLYEISRLLEAPMNWFFESFDADEVREAMPHGGRDRTIIDLVANFNAIQDPHVRSVIGTLIKTVSGKEARQRND